MIVAKIQMNVQLDDDMAELTRKVKDADGVIMSSPVYFGDMTGLAKSFIDRLRPLT